MNKEYYRAYYLKHKEKKRGNGNKKNFKKNKKK